MAEKIVLQLETRTAAGKASAKLRAAGLTPAIVYGHGAEAEAVSVDSRELDKVYARAGGNTIIGLKIDDARQRNALIHQVQADVRTGQLIHADFYLIRMDEKLKAEIPLHFVGESTAVYQQEGSLMRPLEAVEIEALPADLPERFEVDISVLDDFEKSITVADLAVPNGVEILTPAEELIARVEAPRSDADLEDLDAPVVDELPEDVKEDQEVISEEQATEKEPENKAAGADPTATK
jgi:large subunit ribosomal protein L25